MHLIYILHTVKLLHIRQKICPSDTFAYLQITYTHSHFHIVSLMYTAGIYMQNYITGTIITVILTITITVKSQSVILVLVKTDRHCGCYTLNTSH